MISNVYSDAKKLLRENNENNMPQVNEKVIKFKYKNYALNEEKIFDFGGVENTLATVVFRVSTTACANLKIKFNNISIFENSIESEEKTITKILYINDSNSISFEYVYEEENEINIEIIVNGFIYKVEKYIPKCIFFSNNFNILKHKILSQNNELLPASLNINNNRYKVSGNNIDININYENGGEVQSYLNIIYINGEGNIILKNSDAEKTVSINNVNDVCMLSSNNYGSYYKFIYLSGEKLSLVVLDSDYNFVNSVALSSLNYIRVKRIKSVVADSPNNYFWAQSIDGVWYLISIRDDGSFVLNFQYKKCEDVVSYHINNLHYILFTTDRGIVVEKLTALDNFESESYNEFKNVDDAIIYNDLLYIINDDFVQEIIL